MKKILLLVYVTLVCLSISNAQDKQIDKIKKLYEQEKYADCIAKTDEYIKDYPAVIEFPAYAVLAAYKQYNLVETAPDKDKYINLVLRNLNRAIPKNKNNQLQTILADNWSLIQTEIAKLGDSQFGAGDKEKAAYYYDYYARFYADTTQNYRSILFPEKNDQVVVTGKSRAENDFDAIDRTLLKNINKTDEQGRKQGLWIKFYSADGTMVYKVTFKDGSPVGDYRRYHQNGAIMAEMFYDEKGYASAKLYDENNMLLAAGFYKGIIRDSIWTFHYGDKLMLAEEHYINGVKTGKTKSFYEDGTVAEESVWVKGVQNGVWRQFFPDGKVKFETKMLNGQRQGTFYAYFPNGFFEIKGQYKNDVRHGTWQYYNTQGTLLREEVYIEGRLETDIKIESMKANLATLQKRQTEAKGLSVEEKSRLTNEIAELEKQIKQLEDISKDEVENKELLELEKNKGNIIDPEKYINNPLEYFQKNRSGGK